jgi:hypothetical protein
MINISRIFNIITFECILFDLFIAVNLGSFFLVNFADYVKCSSTRVQVLQMTLRWLTVPFYFIFRQKDIACYMLSYGVPIYI